jgi:transposase InsO family protein
VGRRYTDLYRKTALSKAEERLVQEGTIRELCHEMGHSFASHYRWIRRAEAAARPGPREPEGEIEAAMIQEIRTFDREKRATWGAQKIHRECAGVIPRSLIQEILQEQRAAGRPIPWAHRGGYEFAAPQVAYSADFIAVRPRGRVLKVQDDRARYRLGYAYQEHWPADQVAQFVAEIFRKHGPPLFFKHDRGTEFTSADFQKMLRAHQAIAVPSPPHYPPANGKNERGNLATRRWIAPTEEDLPTVDQIMEEMRAETLDQNLARRMAPLGGRTPEEVFAQEPRLRIDRPRLYFEWECLCARILGRLKAEARSAKPAQLEVQRIAALIVVRKWNLVRYLNPEAPKLSP